MHAGSDLSNDLELEVPLHAPARRLAARLNARWTTWTEDLEDSTLVIVQLDSRPTSFARVMRIAEEWVEREKLGAIRFGVDGRTYLLEAGEAMWELDVPVR